MLLSQQILDTQSPQTEHGRQVITAPAGTGFILDRNGQIAKVIRTGEQFTP